MKPVEGAIRVPPEAIAIRLHRIVGERLIACEPISFPGGATAVELVLRRARISGRVEIDGEVECHLADLLDCDGDVLETVALDAASYRALKTRWMPTKIAR